MVGGLLVIVAIIGAISRTRNKKSVSTGEALHYENMPMQYTEVFKVVKNDFFSVEKV